MKTIIANPPFSATWNVATSLLGDERFKGAGKLAPKSKADYAFILDIIYYLSDDGIAAIVLPHGVLFRGSSERVIRQYLIEKMNYIDAIIGLPPNIFYGTQIPTCVLIAKKNRRKDGIILFIDASKEFEKAKNKNLLKQEHIGKIVKTYQNRSEIEKYSHCATLQEIRDNDFNLNISRYIDTFEKEEDINIYEVITEIEELEKKRDRLDVEVAGYLKELGILKRDSGGNNEAGVESKQPTLF